MAYVDKQRGKPTGSWIGEVEVTVQGGGKTRYRRSFRTKGEAEGYEAYVRATGFEPAGTSKAPTLPFATVAERFKAADPEWGLKDPSSIQRLDRVCERLGALDIRAVTTSELDKLVDWLVSRPGKQPGSKFSNATVNRYLAAASKVLRFAHQRGMTEGLVHVPFRRAKSERLFVLSEDMEDAVCRYIESHVEPDGAQGAIAFCIRVLAATGFRKGELWRLKPEQIEDEWITLEADQTKTDKPREVYVEPEMATRLRALVAAKALPKADRVYRHFKSAVKANGGHEKITLHTLRHTRASRLIGQGVESLLVADLLGHSSLATTRKYVHSNREMLKRASKKVENMTGDSGQKGDVVAFKPHTKTA